MEPDDEDEHQAAAAEPGEQAGDGARREGPARPRGAARARSRHPASRPPTFRPM